MFSALQNVSTEISKLTLILNKVVRGEYNTIYYEEQMTTDSEKLSRMQASWATENKHIYPA